MLAAALAPRFAVHGTGGSWLKWGLDPQEDALKAGARPSWPPPAGWGVDANESRLTAPVGEALQDEAWPLQRGCQGRLHARCATRCVAKAPTGAARQAIAVMALIELGQRSARGPHAGAGPMPELAELPKR